MREFLSGSKSASLPLPVHPQRPRSALPPTTASHAEGTTDFYTRLPPPDASPPPSANFLFPPADKTGVGTNFLRLHKY